MNNITTHSRVALTGVLLLLTTLVPADRASAQAIPAGYVALERVEQLSGPLAALVSLNLSRRPLREAIAEIAQQSRLSYAGDPQLPGMDTPVSITVNRVTARDALLQVLRGIPLRAVVSPQGQVVFLRRDGSSDNSSAAPPDRVRLSGYIRNRSSAEVIRHAFILVDRIPSGRESNEEGFYFLSAPRGERRITVRAIGFSPLDTVVNLDANVIADFQLSPVAITLADLTVTERKGERSDLDPKAPDMSVVRLDLNALKQAPKVLGESDAIRSLTLLPGVASASDATTAFSVRGGGTDQNLILLDESTIYNPSHILGFLSVFNSDALDDITLYKGAIPARFGGRLSSVVDIRQREGNSNEFVGNASIGLLSSRAMAEGPLPGIPAPTCSRAADRTPISF